MHKTRKTVTFGVALNENNFSGKMNMRMQFVSPALFKKILPPAEEIARIFRQKKRPHKAAFIFPSGPEGSRTPNLLIRSQMLYPVKLRVRE
jgi:hypothetical protein